LIVHLDVLLNPLLDVREADLASQSADTIKLNFNPCVLTEFSMAARRSECLGVQAPQRSGLELGDPHGLRISIVGHEGRWPISTVKHIES
jgi:hypothetical protein